MLEGLTKRKKWLIMLAICCAGYGAYSDSVVIPLLSSVMAEFPDTSPAAFNMFITGASAICAITFALLTGILVKFVSKRTLIIAGTILFFIGGVGGVFAGNMNLLILTRALDGISDGILATASASLIAELFSDEKERSRVFALYVVASSVFSIITASVSGYLCTFGWRLGFLANIASFIPIILAVALIPKTPPEPRAKRTKDGTALKWNPAKATGAVIMFMILSALSFVAVFLLDIYISENGIGNSVLTGVSSSLGMIVCLVVTLFFTAIYMRLKKYLPVMFSAMITLTYLLLIEFRTAVMLVAALVVLNVAQGLAPTYYQMKVAQNTPQERMGLMMSLYTISIYGGNLLAPNVSTLFQSVFPQLESLTATFVPVCVSLAVITVFYAARLITGAEKRSQADWA